MKEEKSCNEFISLTNTLLARLEQEVCHEPMYYLDVAVRLFRFWSQVTLKCNQDKTVAHEVQPSVALTFLKQFADVFCDLLQNRHTATWNPIVLCNKEPGCDVIYAPALHYITHTEWVFN